MQLAIGDYNILVDTLDIALIAYLIYKGIQLVRETRAVQLVKGLALLAAFYLIVYVMQLRTTLWLLNRIIEMGIIIVFIVFQPELRSMLERAGRTKMSILPFSHNDESMRLATIWGQPIDVICEAAQRLSITATGALIVIEREVKLGDQISTGVVVDALPSVELMGNIFFKNSPLHDGAMIMRDGKIYAAGCFLPKPKQEQDIDKNLGSRHRAAIGVSEVSDSLTVVISEETGGISLAVNGRLIRNLSVDKLHQTLDYYLLPQKTDETAEQGKKPFFRKRNR
jgi:diadenylate cyclase